jgi:hypothetical protein
VSDRQVVVVDSAGEVHVRFGITPACELGAGWRRYAQGSPRLTSQGRLRQGFGADPLGGVPARLVAVPPDGLL